MQCVHAAHHPSIHPYAAGSAGYSKKLWNKICPEMLKAWGIVGLSYLSGVKVVADWGGGSRFQKGGPEGVLQFPGYHTAQVEFIPGCWKGRSDQLSNLRFRRSNGDSVLAMEQWTSS